MQEVRLVSSSFQLLFQKWRRAESLPVNITELLRTRIVEIERYEIGSVR